MDWELPGRPAGAGPGPGRRGPGQALAGGGRHGPADLPRRLRRRAPGAGAPGAGAQEGRVRDERVRRDAAGRPLRRAEADLRRRDHRRRRPRPVDRLPPRRPPRDHERRRPRARLHRLGQLRSQHHHHQGQLRPAGGRALLPAQPGAVPAPGGRDRLRRHARQQGHPLAGALHHHGPDRAGAGPPQHRLRGEDQLRRARGDRDHLPRDRPGRRRPLPGARRVVPRGGGDGPPRPRRLGLRAGRGPPWCRPRAGHRGHRAHRRGRPGDGGGDRRRPDRRGNRAQRGRRPGHARSPTGPASGCPSARTRCRRS